ncbi:MAG: HD domain-containing phosphohydrolase [Nannocystales bacterium]
MAEILGSLPPSIDQSARVPGDELVEVLASLSLAADSANGVPEETSLRTCLVAHHIAAALGLSPEVRGATWFAALLRFLGCTAFAHEEYVAFGNDDVSVRSRFSGIDYERVRDVLPAAWNALGEGNFRAARMGRMLVSAGRTHQALATSACAVGERLAHRLKLPEESRLALAQLHERWDGRGAPQGLRETELAEATRILHAACVIEATHRMQGADAALEEVFRRRRGHLDPDVVAAAEKAWSSIAVALGQASVWDLALGCRPADTPAPSLAAVCEVFADFVDLKLPHALGHGRRVSSLASGAAKVLGLGEDVVSRLAIAGLVHNLGHVGIGNHVWESRVPWTSAQRQLVERHPQHGAQALGRAQLFADVRPLVALHHERCDGSGYPNGLTLRALPVEVRVLAAADVAVALSQRRPHRGGLGESKVAEVLEAEALAGRLDGRAVAAVLEAAGLAARGLPELLSAREAQVLELLTLGESNKAIAQALGISAKTVQHHVHSVYQKAGVSSRAAAALWAVERGYF